MENKPSAWFFAEWISIIGTFVICFVFLFYQNQEQSARADRLYELYAESNQRYAEIRAECNQKYAEIRKDMDQKFYDLLKESRNK